MSAAGRGGYRLAVYYRATTGAGLSAASDLSDPPFAISGTALTVAAPNGGEDYGAGTRAEPALAADARRRPPASSTSG